MNPQAPAPQAQPQPGGGYPSYPPQPQPQQGYQGYGGYGPQVAPQSLPVASPVRRITTSTSNPNSTQNTLQIAEIRDGIVIMNDGTFRSVVMVKSINFDLMSTSEQEAVEYAYQGFLNSLYFPVQIFIRSQKVDIAPYIDRLDRIRTQHDNMLLALLMEDYINYIDVLAQSTNIMDKKFYIVVPYASTPTGQKQLETNKNFFTGLTELLSKKEQRVTISERELDKAKTELRNRVQYVMGGLQQCGIKSLPLDTEELIELYYDTYNPTTAARQHIRNFENLTADVIQKGDGTVPRPSLQGGLL